MLRRNQDRYGSDSVVRFGRAARQLHPHQQTFATTMKSSHSGQPTARVTTSQTSPCSNSRPGSAFAVERARTSTSTSAANIGLMQAMLGAARAKTHGHNFQIFFFIKS